GLDRSREMLSIATQKLPHVRFHRQDMRNFRLAHRFDVIVCVFDSINHLVKYRDWQKVFRRAAAQLKKDGLFIFDINTTGKLRRLTKRSAWVRQFGDDEVIIRVAGGQRGIFEWRIKIFEREKNRHYRLHEETIPELAVRLKRVLPALRVGFRKVEVLDPEGLRPSDQSERLYFVCRAR
ncbi:MAG: class I SAM-dependent DNA methyltransferase, partial [Candidatus Binatia bacterium]